MQRLTSMPPMKAKEGIPTISLSLMRRMSSLSSRTMEQKKGTRETLRSSISSSQVSSIQPSPILRTSNHSSSSHRQCSLSITTRRLIKIRAESIFLSGGTTIQWPLASRIRLELVASNPTHLSPRLWTIILEFKRGSSWIQSLLHRSFPISRHLPMHRTLSL